MVLSVVLISAAIMPYYRQLRLVTTDFVVLSQKEFTPGFVAEQSVKTAVIIHAEGTRKAHFLEKFGLWNVTGDGLPTQQHGSEQNPMRPCAAWSNNASPRLATLISGTNQRFQPSVVDHVILPLGLAGIAADLYLALSFENFTSYAWYAGQYVADPAFTSAADAREELGRRFGTLGPCSKLRVLHVYDVGTPLEPAGQQWVSNGKWWKVPARRNFIKVYYMLHRLWSEVLAVERRTSANYTHVLVVRDDAFWYRDFRFSKLLQTDPRCGSAGPGCVYVNKCGKHSSYGGKGIVDYVTFSERKVSAHFADMYIEVVTGDLSSKRSVKESEQFLKVMTDALRIRVVRASPDLFGFQRLGRKRGPDGVLKQCLHKICNPVAQPLKRLHPCGSLLHGVRPPWY